MTSLTFTRPTIWKHIDDFWKTVTPSRYGTDPRKDSQEEARAERKAILEMLDRNPDAFQCELDVQHMRYSFPCRF